MKRKGILSITVLFCFGVFNTAFAVPITYFGQDNSPYKPVPTNSSAAEVDFLNSLTGGIQTQTFDSIAVGTSGPLVLNFGIFGNATLTGVGKVANNDTSGIGRWPTSGLNYWDTSMDFTIIFDQTIYAFGFYATDIGDGNGHLNLSYGMQSLSNSLSVGNVVPAENGNILYYGFYDQQGFNTISFKGATNTDYFGFDDMTLGTRAPVPEPATMLLFGAGLAGLASIRSKRK